jgi:hypothetical protein
MTFLIWLRKAWGGRGVEVCGDFECFYRMINGFEKKIGWFGYRL